jgi:hypothetical protein
MATGIQGMDTVPQEIAKDFAPLFEKYLPGFSARGIYNYQAGAETAAAALQLGRPMHFGSHPWINDTLRRISVTFHLTLEICP